MEFLSRSADGLVPNSTLLVATVSVGNVGQLACELVLANHPHTLVGYLSDPNVLPCFGHDPFTASPLSASATSLELYSLLQGIPSNVYVLQQRAPAQIGRQRAFAKNMAQWIAQQQFKRVIVLSSMDADLRQDAQIRDRRCWYVHVGGQPVPELDRAGLMPLTSQTCSNLENLMPSALPPWSLLSECQKHGVVAVALVTFTVEGDNVPDGKQQAQSIGQCLNLTTVDALVLPPSAQALYGRNAVQD